MISDKDFKNLFDDKEISVNELFNHIPGLEEGSLKLYDIKRIYKIITVNGIDCLDYNDGLPVGVL